MLKITNLSNRPVSIGINLYLRPKSSEVFRISMDNHIEKLIQMRIISVQEVYNESTEINNAKSRRSKKNIQESE